MYFKYVFQLLVFQLLHNTACRTQQQQQQQQRRSVQLIVQLC